MPLRPLVLAVLATGVFACTKPTAPDAKVPPAPTADPKASAPAAPFHHVYRLDYTLQASEADRPASSSAYSLTVEETASGEIRLGKNVPLQSAAPPPAPSASAAPASSGSAAPARGPFPSPRIDVGLSLRCHFTVSGDDVLLHSDLEMSTADQAPAIRKISLRGDALVSPGKSVLVASSEDPATHQRYQLSVTATKLR